jgi:hypothetical protein
MTITADDLEKTVVAQFGADGSIRAIGKLVGYQDEPTAYIRKPDGELVAWAASLCREATAEEVSKQS